MAMAVAMIGFAGHGEMFGKKTAGCVKTDDGKPLAGVSVSDGIDVVITDKKGKFSIDTELPMGCLFVSTPNGYEPAIFLNNNRPKFWETPKDGKPVNFVLRKIAKENPLGIVAVADVQISNRCGDVELLKTMYVPEVNRAIDSLRNKGTEPIVITLGDQVCDWFVGRGYGYTLDKFNEDFKVNAPVYHTMGNHDNDPFKSGDMNSASTWHGFNGPSYYSFNRGGMHFVVLDNIISDNDDAAPGVVGKSNRHTGMTKEQLTWLAKDLATVKDKNAPLFVTMHAPLLLFPVGEGETLKGIYRFEEGSEELGELLNNFSNVKVLSGHAHKNHYSATPKGNIIDYNYAGANGGWWPAGVTPHKPNLPVCGDGSPWGFGVWDFATEQPTHVFKAFNEPLDFQIRAYDLNKIFVMDEEITKDYLPGNKKNENVVLANVWAYEPGCEVKMFENGKELDVKRVRALDPYLISKYLEPIKAEYGSLNSLFKPEKSAHMFKAKTASATTPVTIEFTDRTGRKFTSVLNR